ncbi:porin family protein [Pontibacter pamirensis]|uniref:porin family protein n=1 Tax=Pontibacter pamirensis TaxID=2562824 RepID=UPI0013897BE7|nr:porin family protein [Pontibacter pamirensis]
MRKILLLPMFLFFSFTGFAQIEGPTTVQQNHNLLSGLDAPNEGVGIKGGVNFSRVHGSDKDNLGDVSGHTNFHAGVFAQFALTEFFSIQPEVLYSRTGYERNDSTFRFNYFDVPVLAVFNISDNFSVHLGPQVGLMIASKEDGSEIDLGPYNTFSYGAAAGLEGRINRFRLGARYVHGLADLRKEDDAGNSIDQDIKNGVIQVYIGIGF